jgi:hypothetical protein
MISGLHCVSSSLSTLLAGPRERLLEIFGDWETGAFSMAEPTPAASGIAYARQLNWPEDGCDLWFPSRLCGTGEYIHNLKFPCTCTNQWTSARKYQRSD